MSTVLYGRRTAGGGPSRVERTGRQAAIDALLYSNTDQRWAPAEQQRGDIPLTTAV